MGGYRGGSMAVNLGYCMNLLDIACAQKPDIVCLPENFVTVGIEGPLKKIAQTAPGPITDACAKRAKKSKTYVICPLTTKRGGKFFNSAVIIDRNGQIAGVYDKLHPVTTTDDFTQAERGMMPGSEAKVFNLDFGRVACQICFDLGFAETWQELKKRGAEIVFWPSAYDGGFPLMLFAYLHQYYVVSSVRTSFSRIINPLGEVLERTDHRLRVKARTIDLDYVICHCDFHTRKAEELMSALGSDVTVRMRIEEGFFMAESNRDDLPISEIAKDFRLEPSTKYYARHYDLYKALLAGKKPEPQLTPYKGREQWA